MGRFRRNNAGPESINLDMVLRHVRKRQLILRKSRTYPASAVIAVADSAWRCLTRIDRGRFEIFMFSPVQRELCLSLARRLERTGHQVFDHLESHSFGSGGGCILVSSSLSQMLEEYRGLARMWDAQLRVWADFVAAFAAHTTAFLSTLQLKPESAAITELESDRSDLHNGGRSVTRVRFQDTKEWFYKPRSGKREAAWFQLLEAFNRAGFHPPFLIPEVHPSQEHCWMRGIRPVKYRNFDDRRRFYCRTGALLYLAHIFRAVDLHADNFIIHGEHPVLIDCETLFHPETRLPAMARVDERDLARTGMLPVFGKPGGNSFIDPSNERHTATGTSFRAFTRGHDRDELVRGFCSMHELLGRLRNARHIQHAVEELRHAGTRHIFRPTLLYYRLLDQAISPARLRAPGGPYRFLRHSLNDRLCKPDIVRQEIQQLLNGDIPIFNGRPSRARHRLSKREFQQSVKNLGERLEWRS